MRVQPNCKMEGLGRELVRVPRYCKHEVHDNRSIPDLATVPALPIALPRPATSRASDEPTQQPANQHAASIPRKSEPAIKPGWLQLPVPQEAATHDLGSEARATLPAPCCHSRGARRRDHLPTRLTAIAGHEALPSKGVAVAWRYERPHVRQMSEAEELMRRLRHGCARLAERAVRLSRADDTSPASESNCPPSVQPKRESLPRKATRIDMCDSD